MNPLSTKYVVITPVRDEEAYLPLTIDSMANQIVRPYRWVLVNDGSTDRTGAIIDEAAARYPFIRTVHRTNRGFRKAGGGVVDAFNDGYREVEGEAWDFVVKLDGDLSFAPDYFLRSFEYFEKEPKLGIAGGSIYHMVGEAKVLEACPKTHVRGATKIYRTACWRDIGGFWPAPGWDTMDEVKAQRLGWKTRTFDDLHLLHHRYTGSADGFWRSSIKNGRANYICGYHPLFMICKCLGRLPRKPYVLGAVGLFWGFFSGYLKSVPQVDDKETIQFLRRQQLWRLTGHQSG